MITTATAAFILESGSQRQFNGCSIICEPTYLEPRSTHSVRLRILDSVSTNELESFYMEVTAAEVNAETGSGSAETDTWFNALQKAVKTKLVVLNGSTTFTIV